MAKVKVTVYTKKDNFEGTVELSLSELERVRIMFTDFKKLAHIFFVPKDNSEMYFNPKNVIAIEMETLSE